MSQPRFFADHDFNEKILQGLLRREPSIDIERAREHGLESAPDEVLLHFATAANRILLSHDKNTLRGVADAAIRSGAGIAGVLLVQQGSPIGKCIDDLLLIWSASEAEEWLNRIAFLPYS